VACLSCLLSVLDHVSSLVLQLQCAESLRCVRVCAGVNAQLVQVVNFDETLKCLAAGVYKLQVALNHPPPAGSLHAW
jgi:hypothetical protein